MRNIGGTWAEYERNMGGIWAEHERNIGGTWAKKSKNAPVHFQHTGMFIIEENGIQSAQSAWKEKTASSLR